MLLKLENIGKIYNSNDILVVGIRGINLEFDYNEFVTIEGESGSGKSTLLNVIGANDSYEEGEMYLNGNATSHFSELDWEKYREENIATVFQDFNIIENLTVLENVELALLRYDDSKKRKQIAKSLIEKVGLTKQMNQKGSKLSGGEKQRTVIARALAKDSPIILADEPTGNLDVQASKDIAALLKDVSKDKLVIVVTHNPEFFKEYATRRVRIFDGSVSEDEVIEKPIKRDYEITHEIPEVKKFHNTRNVFHLGVLNYKSRPKFTLMMSLALLVCALTLFIVISMFGNSLIKPLTTNLDGVGIDGKVIVSSETQQITENELDKLAYETGAGFFFLDKSLTEFNVNIPKTKSIMKDYSVTCLYAPYVYNLSKEDCVLVLPKSLAKDALFIKDVFLKANIGLKNMEIKEDLYANDVRLYLSYDILKNNGKQIKAINTGIKLGEDKSTVFTFGVDESLKDGEIKLVNSNYWNVINKTVVFDFCADKAYKIIDDKEKDDNILGLMVKMNIDDYNHMFLSNTKSKQACLYFNSDKTASQVVDNMNKGYMGLLASRDVYVQNAGDLFTQNIMWYIAMIAVSILFGIIISIIFMRSIKVFQTDFAVYRTLGIPSKVSLKSLYVQMTLIFLPTLVLLPIISLIAAVIPGSTLPFISVGNFFFIEIMLLLIVELVAFGFNKSLNGQSIRKSLKGGTKS